MQHEETEGTRNDRIELRATPQEKALLTRAAAIEHLDINSFIMRAALLAAQEVIEQTEHIKLSERDTLFVLDLLENPPPPNAKLIAAAQAWADNQQMLQATGDNSQNTGEDLIAFFRNSPLADVALELELELERNKATNPTITF